MISNKGLSTGGTSVTTTSNPVDSPKQSRLKTILFVGVAAALLVGLIYLEVKYHIPSLAIALLVSNPYVLAGLLVVGAAAIAYLVYRNFLQTPDSSSAWIVPNSVEEPRIEYIEVDPASDDEFQAALVIDQTLSYESVEDFLDAHFSCLDLGCTTLAEAQAIVRRRYGILKRLSDEASARYNAIHSGNNTDEWNAMQAAAKELNEFNQYRPITLRLLMAINS